MNSIRVQPIFYKTFSKLKAQLHIGTVSYYNVYIVYFIYAYNARYISFESLLSVLVDYDCHNFWSRCFVFVFIRNALIVKIFTSAVSSRHTGRASKMTRSINEMNTKYMTLIENDNLYMVGHISHWGIATYLFTRPQDTLPNEYTLCLIIIAGFMKSMVDIYNGRI